MFTDTFPVKMRFPSNSTAVRSPARNKACDSVNLQILNSPLPDVRSASSEDKDFDRGPPVQLRLADYGCD